MLKKVVYSLAIGWTFLVAFFCLVDFHKLPSLKIPGIDKYVHFTFHFVFTLLWGSYCWLKQDKMETRKIVTIVVLSLSYGILIEVLQECFTTTRHADPLDVLANLTGALMAFGLLILFKTNKERQKVK